MTDRVVLPTLRHQERGRERAGSQQDGGLEDHISSLMTARIPERLLRPVLATTLLQVGAKLVF